jgi:hypothetical protein
MKLKHQSGEEPIMNIKEIRPEATFLAGPQKTTRPEPKEADFERCLTEATNGTCSVSSGSAVSSVADTPEARDLDEVRRKGISAAENALNLLEDYRNAMGDPGISLKEIDPIVKSMLRETEKLAGLSGLMPSADPLAKILDGLGIVSTVEAERFNRGEYI